MVLRQRTTLKGCCILALVLTGTVHADQDKRVIRQVVKQHLPKIMTCYEKTKGEYTTRIVVDFTIDTKGRVKNASASGGENKELQSCIAQEFAKMLFEPSKGAVQVRYPLHIHVAGQ